MSATYPKSWPVVFSPLEITAEIVCRLEKFGPICEWKGARNGVGVTYLEDILYRREYLIDDEGRIKLGGLSLRVLGRRADSEMVYVGLDSPHNELYLLYRRAAEKVVRFIYRCEVAAHAFMLKPFQGKEMPFTKRLAMRLL